MDTISNLPQDVLRVIINLLDYKSQHMMSLASKYWYDLVTQELSHQYKLKAKYTQLQVNITLHQLIKQPVLSKLISEHDLHTIMRYRHVKDVDNYMFYFNISGIMVYVSPNNLGTDNDINNNVILYVNSQVTCECLNYTVETDNFYELYGYSYNEDDVPPFYNFVITANFTTNDKSGVINTLHGVYHTVLYCDRNQVLDIIYNNGVKTKQQIIVDDNDVCTSSDINYYEFDDKGKLKTYSYVECVTRLPSFAQFNIKHQLELRHKDMYLTCETRRRSDVRNFLPTPRPYVIDDGSDGNDSQQTSLMFYTDYNGIYTVVWNRLLEGKVQQYEMYINQTLVITWLSDILIMAHKFCPIDKDGIIHYPNNY